MCRSTWKWLFIVVFVAVSLMTVATDAKAYWGCCGAGGWGGYGWSGYGWSGCGWSGGYGWYGGCGWGGHHRRSCGYWGGWGYGCGYSSCCGWSSVGSNLCCGATGTAVPSTYAPGTTMPVPTKAAPVQPTPMPNEPTPAMPAESSMPGILQPATPGAPALPSEPAPAPGALTPPPGTSEAPTQSNSGILTVWVPYNAKVTVNGLETRSTGSKRQFVSYGLRPGFSYKYEIRAEVVRNGQLETETRSAVLTAGERSSVAFAFNPKAKEAEVALSR